jgi:hypothetical protein
METRAEVVSRSAPSSRPMSDPRQKAWHALTVVRSVEIVLWLADHRSTYGEPARRSPGPPRARERVRMELDPRPIRNHREHRRRSI